MTIKSKTFSGITFKNKIISYDGNYHSIYVEGAPSFATVTYSGNNKKELGTYTVTATVSATGYNSMTLTATMTIAKVLPSVDMPDRTLIYDGNNQKIDFEYPSGLSNSTKAEFKINGVTVDQDDFKVKEIGTYTVSVTLSNISSGYADSVTTATIKVIANTIGTVDSNKTAYTITNNYQALRSKILEGNFTVIYKYYDDYDYDKDGTFEERVLGHTEEYYVANGEMFSLAYYADENNRFNDGQRVNHAKIIDDECFNAEFLGGLLNDSNCAKIPASAYQENTIGKYGLQAMAYVTEDKATGGFANGLEGGYADIIGKFNLDTAKNTFTQITDSYYSHDEYNHSEHYEYTISNIGNTLINTGSDFSIEILDSTEYLEDIYNINGIRYSTLKGEATAYLDFDCITLVFLGNTAEIIIPAYFNDCPVTSLNQSYYYPSYYSNDELSGITIKVFFDEDGNYQGEYVDIGYIKNRNYLRNLADDGATILYYNDWCN